MPSGKIRFPFPCRTVLAVVLLALMTILPAFAQSGSMRGFADIHSHQFANEAFGGYVVAGKAYGPLSDALSEAQCRAGHSPSHGADILGGFLAGYGGPIWYNNDGYPNFSGWPRFFEVSHQKVHEEALHRAVLGGMRLMVMFATESPILCQAVKNGLGRSGSSNCNDEVPTINSQIESAKAMQDFIDNENGGPGQGWYRVVTTPAEARDAIKQGKLAVVLGVETAHLFNCRKEPCSWEGPLNDLWSLGVRHFFPIHQDQNAFGGPSYFQTSIQNGSNELGVQSYKFPLIPCGYTFPNTHLSRGGGECDALGLTATGKDFIQRLMGMGALIDVDHMSDRSFSDTLTIAESMNYPVVASHAGFNAVQQRQQDHEGHLTDEELRRIQGVHGMVGLISSPGDLSTVGTYTGHGITIEHRCGDSTETFVQPYLYALDHAPGMRIAIGTDFNGPLRQLGPRFGSYACNGGTASGTRSTTQLGNSFLARGSNTMLTPFKTGSRTWNYNLDGLAHVGLLPDLLADLEVLGVQPSDLEPVFNSAEGYVQMWERATSHTPTQMLLDSAGQVWAKNTIGNGGWTQETPGGEKAIAAGVGGLQMLLDSSGQVWAKNAIGNGGWTLETPAGEIAIAAGGNGLQMLLDRAGQVWAKDTVGNQGWTQESPGGEIAIAAGEDGLQILLDSAGQVWAKNTIGSGGWTLEMTGGAVAIAAGGSGLQMVLDNLGRVWAKASIGGGGWTLESPGGEKAIAAGSNGLQMLLDGAGQVWAKSTIGNGGWTLESPAGEKYIAAGNGGLQMLLDGAGQVWAKNTIGNGGWSLETPAGEARISGER